MLKYILNTRIKSSNLEQAKFLDEFLSKQEIIKVLFFKIIDEKTTTNNLIRVQSKNPTNFSSQKIEL